MNISEKGQRILDEQFTLFFELLNELEGIFELSNPYSNQPHSKVIKFKSGLIIEEALERPFVLDNTFDKFLLEKAKDFFREVAASLAMPITSFAMRSLYEFVTIWLYIFYSDDVLIAHKDRFRTLLFAGHFKFIAEEKGDFDTYYDKKLSLMRRSDRNYFNSEDIDFHGCNNRLFDVIKDCIRANYDQKNLKYLKGSEASSIFKSMSMQVHANPISVVGIFGADSTNTNRYLLYALMAQFASFFSIQSSKEFIATFEKFVRDGHVSI